MSCQDRRSSAWAAAWHAMSPEVEVGGLVMSLSRWAMFRWNRDFEWILNLQKHTKNTPATRATPQSLRLRQISGDFVPRQPAEMKEKTSTKTSPRSMARLKLRCCHDCCWSGTLLIEVASLLRGVFFLFGLWPQKPQGSGNWTTWRARKARQVHRRLEF